MLTRSFIWVRETFSSESTSPIYTRFGTYIPFNNENYIFIRCKTEKDYKYALTATNHFYNFGRQLTPEAIDKLFITTLRCNQLDQAIELIHGSSDWLIRPPRLSLIYLLLGDLMSKGDFDRVFRLYKILRTSW
ncbi:uncharacterized protein TA08500 [Theileria annulata]|uniref:Uncharacterized protein n=1 Tax=Theileria annulata TaxID=5874 RepID=Q4U9L5_THEAN|nr:uncharacterized protein TA08500 [Theileria annulata]CAI76488.1 hypothetical protein, conserved [Theileria annulata]|eukprot:XP_953113.1 hypothetical protein, conserved [Theileria annulata]